MNKAEFQEKKIMLVINNIKVKHADLVMQYLKGLKRLEHVGIAVGKSGKLTTVSASTVGKRGNEERS